MGLPLPPAAIDVVPTSPTSPPSSARAFVAGALPTITLPLVLGHHCERLVRDDIALDYAEIAPPTALTRARVCQISDLTLLAPDVQEAILGFETTAQGDDPMHDRRVREFVAEPDWSRQLLLWTGQSSSTIPGIVDGNVHSYERWFRSIVVGPNWAHQLDAWHRLRPMHSLI